MAVITYFEHSPREAVHNLLSKVLNHSHQFLSFEGVPNTYETVFI